MTVPAKLVIKKDVKFTSILSDPIRLNNSQQIHYLHSISQHNLNRISKNAVSFFSRKTCQKAYNAQAPANNALSLATAHFLYTNFVRVLSQLYCGK